AADTQVHGNRRPACPDRRLRPRPGPQALGLVRQMLPRDRATAAVTPAGCGVPSGPSQADLKPPGKVPTPRGASSRPGRLRPRSWPVLLCRATIRDPRPGTEDRLGSPPLLPGRHAAHPALLELVAGRVQG